MKGEVDFCSGRLDFDLRNFESEASAASHSPLLSAGIDFRFAGNIQLHNRAELVARFSAEHCSDANLSSAGLVLCAYRKWGADCANFLLGEFAFAIWDERERSLFCCRDHMGVRPFFYWTNQSRFVFAGDPIEILKTPGVPRRPNLRKIAAGRMGGFGLYSEETFHAEIRSLPPGSWMVVTGTGARQQKYWSPKIRENLVPRDDHQAFEVMAELLHQAVACRIEGARAPAALLSGGLDSSSIVALAARYLGARDRELLAFSAVVSDELREQAPDEREYIDEFRHFTGVRLNYVTAPGRGPFDDIDDASRFESTFLLTSRNYLYEALRGAAIEHGADVLLEGNGGENGPTNWGSQYYAELAFHGRWPTLIRELRALKRRRGTSPVRALGGQFREMLRMSGKAVPLFFVTEEFARTATIANFPRKPAYPSQRQTQLAHVEGSLRRHVLRSLATARTRVAISDPYTDKRVVEFCLAAPARLKVRDGYQRYLIRRALEDILPPRIQWRTSKVPFSPDYSIRYNAQLEKARRFVNGISRRDPVRSVVDVDKLNEVLRPLAEPQGNLDSLTAIPLSIYLILFLRQFPEFRP